MLDMFFGDGASIFFTVTIFVLGLWAFIMIINTAKKLVCHKNKLDEAVSVGKVHTGLDENASLISYADLNATPKEDVTEMHKEFFEICADNNVINQMISLLPSLGILGTVVGLVNQVNANGIEEMTGSIGLALGSTGLALSFTIVLKIVAILTILRKIDLCEIEYDNYDRQRQDLRIENKQ